jgi:hypothetical protein
MLMALQKAGLRAARTLSDHHQHSNRAPSDWYPLFPNPVVAEHCWTG